MSEVEKHVLLYTCGDNEVIEVVVPWGLHSGNIPPPSITFWSRRGKRQFTYSGSQDTPHE